MNFKIVSAVGILVLLGAMQCARRAGPSAPSPVASPPETQCKTGARRQCLAFTDGGFVEAYVRFFFARESELPVAFPHSVGASGTREPPLPDAATMARADSLRTQFPELSCYSITELELDALGDALGVPRPARKPYTPAPAGPAPMTPYTGKPFSAAELKNAQAGPLSHLAPARFYPEGCGTIYEVPVLLVAKMISESDHEKIGELWTAAIVALGPNPAVLEDEVNRASQRNHTGAWSAIARDLHEFAKENECGGRNLYVEIQYDC